MNREKRTYCKDFKEKTISLSYQRANIKELSEATKKWTMPIRNWGVVLNQFLIIFGDRLKNLN